MPANLARGAGRQAHGCQVVRLSRQGCQGCQGPSCRIRLYKDQGAASGRASEGDRLRVLASLRASPVPLTRCRIITDECFPNGSAWRLALRESGSTDARLCRLSGLIRSEGAV